MAEVPVTGRADDFDTDHPVARVGLGPDAVEGGRLDEARPARPRVELRVGAEDLAAAAGAAVHPVPVLIPVRAGERALGSLLPEDRVLLRRQPRAPLLVSELDPGLDPPSVPATVRCMDADPVELRILGCLVEKQRTTPDVYPLTLNALRLACNQSTNRDPVVAYDDETIRTGLARLSRKGLARLASGPGTRVVKYRHLLDEALRVSHAELGVVAVLMLRGAQTPGELKTRTERLHPFASLQEVDGVLEALIERGLAERLERRPGQKEDRYGLVLAGAELQAAGEEPTAAGDDRVGELEARVQALEEAVEDLRLRLGDAGLERGGEGVPDRVELHAVEDVLEEAADDQPFGL
jgi:uncharacterized protein